ncbi:MAG: S8 family serine peptidase [Alphaproteobacteria bacterium]|nr:S8 family serine peptidase [Alphaproteobacteria bacterium]
MYIRILSIIALFCLTISSPLEGRSHSSTRHHAQTTKKKTQVLSHITQKKQHQVERKRPTRVTTVKQLRSRRAIALKKRPQKTVVTKRSPSRLTQLKQKPQLKRVALQRRKSPSSKAIPHKRTRRLSASPVSQHQRKASLVQKKQTSQIAFKRTQAKQHLQQKTSAHRNIPQKKADYLSLLPYHDQQRAKDGGLDKLLTKDMKGQGQTVAVIELSGVWKDLKDAINDNKGPLSPSLKANYKSNFLAPIGGPGLHPEQMNEWIRDCGNLSHGSSVASVILDMAPQAKVLPVSTYNTYGSSQFYDTADALMDLSRRPDVSIINMSSGFTKFNVTLKKIRNKSGREEELAKRIYPPKLTEAFKAVAKAGKVVIIAARNDGKPIDTPRFFPEGQIGTHELVGYLMQELDPETRKSIILAGSCDLEERKIAAYSNKPGALKNAQEAFLLAPGHYATSFDNDVAIGTSFAAPYICAAIANLTSHRKISPKRAVQALKDTAERRPDVATYGRGIIRADKALELLERAGGG